MSFSSTPRELYRRYTRPPSVGRRSEQRTASVQASKRLVRPESAEPSLQSVQEAHTVAPQPKHADQGPATGTKKQGISTEPSMSQRSSVSKAQPAAKMPPVPSRAALAAAQAKGAAMLAGTKPEAPSASLVAPAVPAAPKRPTQPAVGGSKCSVKDESSCDAACAKQGRPWLQRRPRGRLSLLASRLSQGLQKYRQSPAKLLWLQLMPRVRLLWATTLREHLQQRSPTPQR